eukprot:gnl/TRDRNA2_/TRDRNA2_136398_c0_seq1.p1 gnl/TRDRNA2_/TRDRNA2_136398_c0~~gnl/TRDRNA2_/TRDRNA2_136398_c0_seq1.p1  ORF type:complete len:872 (+),score=127.75 gnl/TRDRNA2_/TRDRNA2_136398_c0_seq1:87-2702(+)
MTDYQSYHSIARTQGRPGRQKASSGTPRRRSQHDGGVGGDRGGSRSRHDARTRGFGQARGETPRGGGAAGPLGDANELPTAEHEGRVPIHLTGGGSLLSARPGADGMTKVRAPALMGLDEWLQYGSPLAQARAKAFGNAFQERPSAPDPFGRTPAEDFGALQADDFGRPQAQPRDRMERQAPRPPAHQDRPRTADKNGRPRPPEPVVAAAAPAVGTGVSSSDPYATATPAPAQTVRPTSGHAIGDCNDWTLNTHMNMADRSRRPGPEPAADDAVEGAAPGGELLPPRPTTPCMNRGADGSRRKRTSSAGASGRHSARGQRPSSGGAAAGGPASVAMRDRIAALESRLLGARAPPQAAPLSACSESRSGRESVLGSAPAVHGGSIHTADVSVSANVSVHRPESGRSGRESVLGAAPAVPPPDDRPAPPLRPESRSGRESVLGAAPSVPVGYNAAPTASPAAAAAQPSARRRPASSSGRAGAPRPNSSLGFTAAAGVNAPTSLIEQAIEMCRNSKPRSAPTALAAAPAEAPLELSPRDHPLNRPNAPTPEQTNHWLHGLDHQAAAVASADTSQREEQLTNAVGDLRSLRSRSGSPDSPSPTHVRPRSPTPTKMLAWEDEKQGQATTRSGADCSLEDSDHEGRGDHTDGLIAKLIGACQMNEVDKAFAVYEKLRQMRVPLYEGVYKLIIECCMRTQQLGHAMQFYETLKSSGQRISSRLVIVLMEACAKEQHGDKVHAIWNDWCPPGRVTVASCEVLLVAVSALIRTMSPDLACDILADAEQRSQDDFDACLEGFEVELEELLQLNETAAEDAKASGVLLEELASRFSELHTVLDGMRRKSLQASLEYSEAPRPYTKDFLIMEDVDLDLDLAAM